MAGDVKTISESSQEDMNEKLDQDIQRIVRESDAEQGSSKPRKGDGVWRFLLNTLIVVLLGVVGWLWYYNYSVILEALTVSEGTAESQFRNARHYRDQYVVVNAELNDAKTVLTETTVKLTAAQTELLGVRLDLGNAQGGLAEAQALVDELKKNIAALESYKVAAEAQGEKLEAMIEDFKQKNQVLQDQLSAVQGELAVYQPGIDDLMQGKDKVRLFKEHIRMVKQNMKVIRRKATEVAKAAQKEKDRLGSLYGNGGFLMKQGVNQSIKSEAQRTVDVQFIER